MITKSLYPEQHRDRVECTRSKPQAAIERTPTNI